MNDTIGIGEKDSIDQQIISSATNREILALQEIDESRAWLDSGHNPPEQCWATR